MLTQDIQLPESICASRRGELHGGYRDSEYDFEGELSPVTWTCSCGAYISMARYVTTDDEGLYGKYVDTPQERIDAFLAEHRDCAPYWDD